MLNQQPVLDNMTNNLFNYKSISNNEVKVVNLCDSECIGKTLSDETFEIDISDSYFGGQSIGKTEAIDLLNNSNMLNLVGNRIVKLALELKLASIESVKEIDGISFLLIYKFTQ